MGNIKKCCLLTKILTKGKILKRNHTIRFQSERRKHASGAFGPMRRVTAAPVLSKSVVEECIYLWVTVLCEVRIRAFYFEESVCVLGSVLVLGGSMPLASRFCHCLADALVDYMLLCFFFRCQKFNGNLMPAWGA